jgi:heme/copper-type cytochrome/quinol oxidase subunit 2
VNHAFMPIVIEAISPKDYNNIIREMENEVFKD